MRQHQFNEHDLQAFLRTRSGLQQKRDYVGISVVIKCPAAAYDELTRGVEMTDQAHRMAYAGYLFEADTLERMKLMGIARRVSRPVISPFDDRLCGHVDGETSWGDLLEIKSVSRDKFEKILTSNRALYPHFAQVQLYMRYGKWKVAWIVYVCRDTFEHKVFDIPYRPEKADELELRAKSILKALDQHKRPACNCGHCRQDAQP